MQNEETTTPEDPIDIMTLDKEEAIKMLGDQIGDLQDENEALKKVIGHLSRTIRTVSNIAGNMLGDIPVPKELLPTATPEQPPMFKPGEPEPV